MAQTLQNTLYLLTPGLSVHRDGLALRIEENRCLKLSLPIHNIDSIFVFAPDIYVSPAAMRLCWENRASLAFFTEWGRLEARVEGIPQGSVALRRAQHIASSSPEKAACLSRAIVAGKIHNTRWLVSRTVRDSDSDADKTVLTQLTSELANLVRLLPRAQNTDEIRGIEGRAAALHFAEFQRHIRPHLRAQFPVDGRTRRPPRDAVNCLLSFLYALLRHSCVSALAAVGLDPFVGCLHADRAGRESLALDLMEEFRPWVERIAITLLNRGELKSNAFLHREGGAVELSDNARKTIVTAYQERRRDKVRHPLFQEKVDHRQIPLIQARLLARAIRENEDYTPFLFT
jgi:CRISPR-associated protein Cas1